MEEIEFVGLEDLTTIDVNEETEENEDKTTEEVEENKSSENENSEGVASDNQETEEEEDTENEETTSSPNLYTNLANALIEESVLPNLDLKNKELNNWEDFKDIFKEYIDKEVESKLDETTKFVKEAINNGADANELIKYKNILDNLVDITEDDLKAEGSEAEDLRMNIIYQDYINRGLSKEKAEAKVKKIFDRGDDIDEALDALESNKEFYSKQIEKINTEAKAKSEKLKKQQEDFYKDLYDSVLKDKEPIKGIKINEDISKKILDTLKKPVETDKSGRPLNAIQKYAKENPKDFQKVIGTLFVLTDGFKSFEKIIKTTNKVAKRKAVDELEKVLTSQPIGLSDNPLSFGTSLGKFGRDYEVLIDEEF